MSERTEGAGVAAQGGPARDPAPRWVALAAGLVVFVILLLLPVPAGLSPEGWRVVAVAALMILWWMTEALPVAVTALLPIALFPLTGATSGGAATAPYGDPIIFLFMGGFVLALAMERCNLHKRVALLIVARTGTRQHHIIAGFMAATAFCSMWVSNTATAVMMLPIATSVAALVSERSGDRRFPLALLLSVAYAASIGGLATLIGTPPNALLAGAINQAYGYEIGFAQWMVLGVPLSLAMLAGTWFILVRVAVRVDRSEIPGADVVLRDELARLGPWSSAERRVGLIFLVTATAWILRTLLDDLVPGLNDTSIAILAAISLFLVPAGGARSGALMDWPTMKALPWDVLLLFGGGLSLAAAVVATGLDAWIGGQLGAAAGGLPILLVLALVSLVVLILTEFTSNTATAAAFVPLLAALAVSLGENPLLLAIPAALAASMAFMLPVATPPNALVFGTGHVTIPQMARAGVLLNLLSLVLIVTLGYALMVLAFGVDLGTLPDWAAS